MSTIDFGQINRVQMRKMDYSDPNILKQLGLDPFPYNEDYKFYKDYHDYYLKPEMSKLETKREKIFNKLKNLQSDGGNEYTTYKDNEYIRYKGFFMKVLFQQMVLENYISKSMKIMKKYLREKGLEKGLEK